MAYIGNSPENVLQARTAEYEYTATASQTVFSGVDNNGLSLDLLLANQNEVYLNGSRLVSDDDFTVSGDTLTLTVAAAAGDILVIKTQTEVSNIASYTKAEADSRYVNYSGDIVAGDLQISGTVSATDLVVDTDTLYVDSTNDRVGIGTPSPSANLEIIQSGNNVGLLVSGGGYNYTAKFESSDAEANIIIEDSNSTNNGNMIGVATDDMYFLTAGAERMRIDSSGRVKIGTTSNTPAGDGVAGFVFGDNTAGTPAAGVASFAANSAAPLLLTRLTSDGNVLGIADGTTTRGLLRVVSGNFAIQGNNNLVFSTGGSNTERMRIDSSGNLILKATSDAGNRLQINGADETSELLELGITSGHAQLTATHASGGSNSAGFIFRTRNGTAGTNEKMRLDASGNLLVGTTSGFGSSGITLGSNKVIYAAASSQNVANFQRYTTDGEIVRFGKDGSTVGSIGTLFGDLYVATGNTGIRCVDANRSISAYDSNAGSLVDAAVDLGFATTRFKDLYLSGGVYLGGAGSANHLDDYEEGDFQPYFSTTGNSGSISYSSQQGTYTKIGRRVFFWFDFTVSSWSGATGSPLISLPYASSGTSEMGAFTPWDIHNNYTGSRTPTQWISQNSSWMRMYTWTGDTAMGHNPWAVNQIGRVSGSVSYTSS